MSDSAHPTLATFRVHRDRDVSDVSGTGVVAEGVQFSDGWVVTHWLDQAPMWEPKTDVWHHKGTGPVTKVHGHGGATRIVWTADQGAATRAARATLAEVYDVPVALLGTEAERAYLHRQISGALLDAWQARGETVAHPEEHCAEFTDAVMPIIAQVLEQRERAQASVGRASVLANRWQSAHGSSAFLVRAAGAELREVLDGDDDCVYENRGQCAVYAVQPACGMQQPPLAGFVPGGPCVVRGQHAEHENADGTKWSLIDARDPCPHCEDCPLIPRHLMSDHIRDSHPDIRPDRNGPDNAKQMEA